MIYIFCQSEWESSSKTYKINMDRKYGGLVGDSSIMDINACAALVSQYGPIEINFKTLGLFQVYTISGGRVFPTD